MWRIYYDDKDTHEDGDGPAVGEQARGVQVILQSDPGVGWHMQSGSDYYIWRDGRWWGCDIAGLFDYLMDSGLVLFGRMIDRDEFNEIFSQAMADRKLPYKDSYLPRRMKEAKPDGCS